MWCGKRIASGRRGGDVFPSMSCVVSGVSLLYVCVGVAILGGCGCTGWVWLYWEGVAVLCGCGSAVYVMLLYIF